MKNKNIVSRLIERGDRFVGKNYYDVVDIIIPHAIDGMIRNMSRITGGDQEGKMYKLLEFVGKSRDIADPWYTGNFDDTYNDIMEGLDGLWRVLSAKLGSQS